MRRNLRRTIAFAAAVFLLAGGVSAGAEEDGDGAAAFSGYLFRLKEDAPATVSLMAEDGESGISAVMPDEGIYRAEDMETLARYTDEGWLEYVEPDYYVELYDNYPNDPEYVGAADRQWYLKTLGMQYAWDHGITGEGVRIGVIDSGINSGHEDFAESRIIPGKTYYTPDPGDPAPDPDDVRDVVGHGTFVSGLLCATTNNGEYIASIAPGAEVVMLRCFGDDRKAKISDIAMALEAAVNEFDCQIINMSFGVYAEEMTSVGDQEKMRTLKRAVDAAAAEGVIMVAAVGNDWVSKPGYHSYPASYDNVIGVGATNKQNEIYLNSVNGSQRNESVFVVAPGQGMFSLGSASTTSTRSGDGTSYATPCVAGVAALLKSVDPGLTLEELMDLLSSTSIDLGEPGWDDTFGFGLVDIQSLMEGLELRTTSRANVIAHENGLEVSAYYPDLELAEGSVMAGAYTASGRMVALSEGKLTRGIWGPQIEGLELVPKVPAAEVRVFLADPDTYEPLSEVITIPVP